MKIHLAIASEQALANLIPILMDRPDQVYLICSQEMQERAMDQRLQGVLEHEGIEVKLRHDAPTSGLQSIREYAAARASEIRATHAGAQITFNATGGTKLMSLGFVEVFRGVAQRIIYTDTSHGRIEVFPDEAKAAVESIPMKNVLDVRRYLAAQGFQYSRSLSDNAEWRARVASRKRLAAYLAGQVVKIQQFVGILNARADDALGAETVTDDPVLLRPEQSFRRPPSGTWAEAAARIAQAGLFDWNRGQTRVFFKSADAALFLRGGWLEEYAWQTIQDTGLYDTRCGVEVTDDGGAEPIRNEFDVLGCHGNQLLVVECKTVQYREQNQSEIAYKIDSLSHQVRGLFGETWLLSARDPAPTLVERARRARIRVIGPADLPRLGRAVQTWMQHAAPSPR